MPDTAMDPSLSSSPRRLSERRGIPELQPLEPTVTSKISSVTRTHTDPDNGPQSYDSSLPSGIVSPDMFGTPTISTPATPADISPLRSLAPSLDLTSSVVGSSIREEDERGDCLCHVCEDLNSNLVNGLGLNVGDLGREDLGMEFPRRLDVASPDSQVAGSPLESSYQYDEKLAPFAMPPTPPSHAGERPWVYTSQPSLKTQPSQELIDQDVFSTAPPSLPQSPTSDSSRSRAATILNRVVPAKLRASIKRRMSAANNNPNQPPPLPPIATMPIYSGVRTPPDECNDDFDILPSTAFSRPSMTSDDCTSSLSSPEGTLPPLLSSRPSFSTMESVSAMSSPCQPPRGLAGLAGIGLEIFTDATRHELELLNSPLHPPTISPLVSPLLASTSQTSLNATSSPQSSHKKVPSIDPATPLAPRKLSTPITLVTANSLADMIEEMNTDLAAYDATRARMIESGWSSQQEIKNVELQRKDKERTWQKRIAESKKILEGMRRSEAKHSAVSSVSSLDLDSSSSRIPATLNSTISPSNFGSFGYTNPERMMSRDL